MAESGTTGSMVRHDRAYLADLLASWLGRGGGGADSGQPRSLFPAGLGYGNTSQMDSRAATGPMGPGSYGAQPGGGYSDSANRYGSAAGPAGYGNAGGPMAPVPIQAPTPLPIGGFGPNASMFDDYGAYSPSALSFAHDTTYGRSGTNYTPRPGTPGSNVPRLGVSPANVPGVNAGVPGSVAAPGYGGGSASDYLALVLGGGGRY